MRIPIIWNDREDKTTFQTKFPMEPKLSAPKPSPIWTLLLSPRAWPAANRKNAAPVINPIPPITIRKAITIWPNIVQVFAVFTTINPVTVDADVAVNKESMNEIGSLWAKGRDSKIAPNKIKAKNP